MYFCLGVKYQVILVRFYWTYIADSRKIVEHQICRKSVKWEPICFIGGGDRLTDMTKLVAAFRNSAIAPKTDNPFILSFSAAVYLIFCKSTLQDSRKAIDKLWTANHARELNFLCCFISWQSKLTAWSSVTETGVPNDMYACLQHNCTVQTATTDKISTFNSLAFDLQTQSLTKNFSFILV